MSRSRFRRSIAGGKFLLIALGLGGVAVAIAEPGGIIGASPRFRYRGEARPATLSPNLVPHSAPPSGVGAKTRGGPELRPLYTKIAPATVIVRTEHGYGSGVILPSGLVLTNHHVAADGARDGLIVEVRVEIGRLGETGSMERMGQVLPARVVKWDKRLDLALLKLDGAPPGLPGVAVAEKDVKPGEPVAVLGHGNVGLLWAIRGCDVAAIGHTYEALAREVVKPAGVGASQGDQAQREARRVRPGLVIQTSCTIAPGDSGGPVVNVAGELVGLNDFIVRDNQAGVTSNFHVAGQEIRAFLVGAPTTAQAMLPDPWDAGTAAELFERPGSPETLVVQGDAGRATFVRLRPQPEVAKRTVDDILDSRTFLSDLVILEQRGAAFAWLDTAGAGKADLFLVLEPDKGAVKEAWRLGPAAGPARIEAGAPKTVAEAVTRLPPAQASLAATIVAERFSEWTEAPTLAGSSVPDPFQRKILACAGVDADGDKVPDAYACVTDRGPVLFLDPEQRLKSPLKESGSVDEARRVLPLVVMTQGERFWVLYDRSSGTSIDSALSSKQDEMVFARDAFEVASKAQAVAEPLGRMMLRPGLLKLSPTGATRLAKTLEKVGLKPIVARGESGLGSFPALLDGEWGSRERLQPAKAPFSGVALEREGARAVVVDLSGKLQRLSDPQLAQALAGSKVPFSFAWLRVGEAEWTFYDRDGDGKVDLVLFSAEPETGRSVQAFRVSRTGAVTADPALASGPLFRVALARPEDQKRLTQAFDTLGVRKEARD